MPPPYSPENPWVPPRERTPPAMDHAAGFKESAFSWEMGALILERIWAGETVKQITADPRMPSYATVYRWTHVEPEFGAAWREVRDGLAANARWADAAKAEARAWRRAHERRLAGKPARGWRSGRRSTYGACKALFVCFAIEEGASLSEVVRTPGMPSFKAIYRWLRAEPWFREAYADACGVRDMFARETALEIALQSTPFTWRAARRKAERIEGRAGRMLPRKYRPRPIG